jgi:hypothetical protein
VCKLLVLIGIPLVFFVALPLITRPWWAIGTGAT